MIMPWSTTPPGAARRRLCIDDEKKALAKALDDAEHEVLDATRAVRRGRMRCKRTKQKRIKLLAMGKLKERLRNPPFDLRLAVLDARNDEPQARAEGRQAQVARRLGAAR